MKKYKLITIIILTILLVTLLTLVMMNKISWLDSPIYNMIIKNKSDSLTNFMKIITSFGCTTTVVLLATCSLISLKRKYYGSLFLVGNLIISTILNLIIKNIICRPRPSALRLITESGYSFPSGHSMASLSLYGFTIFLVINSNLSKRLKWIISTLLTLIIIMVGVSRIYLGVHYPSDVIGAYLVSLILLLITTNYIKKGDLL